MKAVILAGGFGTRLSEETDKLPKPMVDIGGWPLLWHIMKIYSRHGIDDFIVCLGYKGYVIKEYFANYALHVSDVEFDLSTGRMTLDGGRAEPWRVRLVETGIDTQTGGRLKRVARYLDDEAFCFTYGDGVGDIDVDRLVAYHREHGCLATVTAVRPMGRFGVLDLDGGRVVGFSEKTDAQDAHINGGFFVLEPGVLEYIDDDRTSWELGPLQRLAADGELRAYHHHGFWQPVDTLRDKRQLESLWASGEAPWKCWA
jgi:glucose-1-phosphate cytidylyltransferase